MTDEKKGLAEKLHPTVPKKLFKDALPSEDSNRRTEQKDASISKRSPEDSKKALDKFDADNDAKAARHAKALEQQRAAAKARKDGEFARKLRGKPVSDRPKTFADRIREHTKK